MQGEGAEFTWKCKGGTQRRIVIFEILFVERFGLDALCELQVQMWTSTPISLQNVFLKIHLVDLNHIKDSVSIFSADSNFPIAICLFLSSTAQLWL